MNGKKRGGGAEPLHIMNMYVKGGVCVPTILFICLFLSLSLFFQV